MNPQLIQNLSGEADKQAAEEILCRNIFSSERMWDSFSAMFRTVYPQQYNMTMNDKNLCADIEPTERGISVDMQYVKICTHPPLDPAFVKPRVLSYCAALAENKSSEV